jgi:hypothetical protein
MIILLKNLQLNSQGMKCESDCFIEIFRKAWGSIPDYAKSIIVEYISLKPATIHLCYEMNATDYVEEPFGRVWYRDTETIITFLAPFILKGTPLECVVGVVAHELAHIYRRGAKIWKLDSVIEEEENRKLCREWGLIECGINDQGKLAVRDWRKKHSVDKSHLTEKNFYKKYMV